MLRRVATLACVVSLSAACSRGPQYFVKSGNQYFEKKQYNEAIVQYRSAIAKNPRIGEARAKLADAYMAVGQPAAALREYVRAADLLPNDKDVQLKTARLLVVAGQYEDAKTRAQQLLEKDPKNVDAQLVRANAVAGLKDLDGAIADIEEAIKIDEGHSPSYANLGYLQQAKGNKAEAEAAYKQAIATDPKSLMPRLALANFYWASKQQAEAEETFKAALALDPKNPATNRALALFYMTSNRAAEAEAPLKVLADTKDAGARLALADYYTSANRAADAKPILDELAKTEATYAPAKLRLAAIAYTAKEKDEAYKIVAEVRARQPRNAVAIITEARLLAADGKRDEALTKAKEAVTVDPKSAAGHFLVGSLDALKSDRDGAIAAFNEVLKLVPAATPAKIELVNLYLGKGDADMAAQLARQAVKERPTPSVRLLLARALMAHKEMSEANEQLDALAREYPQSAVVHTQIGALALARNDRDAARTAFEKAQQLDPRNREALAGLVTLDGPTNIRHAQERIDRYLSTNGDDPAVLLMQARVLLSKGDYAKGEGVLKKIVQTAPATLPAYSLLGQLYLNQHRLDEALAEFDAIGKRQPKSVSAATLVAMILEMQKKPEQAEKQYQKALEIDPHAAVAANNLAWMYAERGANLDVALQLAETAKAQLPDLPEVNDTLGWIYCKKGLPSLAIGPLLESVQKQPKNGAFLYHLGMAYVKNGDLMKARLTLEQALAASPNFDGAAEAKKTLESLKG